ncbi:AcrR family transcriptional regulator [Actinoplanes octamycinicus]|uniref:AcrR family transcriptional regulator n=1 Tax=Actinoplanes octamycinicus TaxID=135948 RepID=A0A7W7H791_9ACTN|nr:TetR/AcrR family transcriptional regulator C-terminal domain-containing protein [Actinoplanes octamycinicus]MBB4745163.1 AcrR family transcriptional regulator [Actinoplanes octamycinicus]GIE62710.1 TetR family transcriptional regulator [Actinoplanes octamycinicus]
MPRTTLTPDQIVRAAIDLLDEQGLDGLNMRSLGQRLDSAATAIYWHIKTKDDLVRLAADAVWTEIPLPGMPIADWRPAAELLATGMHEMCGRHPWLGQAIGSHLVYGPGKTRFDDRTLAVYEAAGFAPADADRAAATVFVFVLGSALGPAAQVSLTRRLSPEALTEAVAQARIIGADFRYVRSRLDTTAGTGYAAAPDETFAFGLRSILDGFAGRLR